MLFLGTAIILLAILFGRLNCRVRSLESVPFEIVFFTTSPDDGEQRRIIMALVKESQQLPLSIEIQTLKGKPAKVDGAPKWEVSDTAVGSLQVADDGLSALFVAAAAGQCSVNVSVDADLGDGVKPILGSLDITVVADEAAIVTIAAGEPQDQP